MLLQADWLRRAAYLYHVGRGVSSSPYLAHVVHHTQGVQTLGAQSGGARCQADDYSIFDKGTSMRRTQLRVVNLLVLTTEAR